VIVSAHDGYPRWLHSGDDFLEMDIRRSRDGAVVLAHDRLRWWRRYVRFDEVLATVPPSIGLHLDLKEAGYELELVGRVLERWAADRVVVTPDFDASVKAVKAGFPRGTRQPGRFHHPRPAVRDGCGPGRRQETGVGLDCRRPATDRALLADSRIEGIITNRPDLALELRSARS
jgi:hypothetical protein